MQNVTGRTKRRQKRLAKKNLIQKDMELNNKIIESLNKKSSKKSPKYFNEKDIKNFSEGKASLNRYGSIEDSNELLDVDYSTSSIYFKHGRDFLNSAYGKYAKVLKEQIVLIINHTRNGYESYINMGDVRKKRKYLEDLKNLEPTLKKNLNNDKIIISFILNPISYKKELPAHQNVILIDNVNKIIERFEPHDDIRGVYPKEIASRVIEGTYSILNYIKNVMDNLTKNNYSIFGNYIKTCPVGLQTIQEKEFFKIVKLMKMNVEMFPTDMVLFFTTFKLGYCQIWSIYYIEKRLQKKYRNIKTEKERLKMLNELVEEMKRDDNLTAIIHKYAMKVRAIALKIQKFKKKMGIDSKSKSNSKKSNRYLSDSREGLSSLERELDEMSFS